MRFTRFYAGSTVCSPSRCVLMTGQHTGRCFIRGNGKENLRPEDVTIAEVLREAGYVSGAFGKWGVGHEGSDGMPTRQGFDAFFGYLDQSHAHNYWPTFLVRDEERVALRNVVPNEGKWGQGVATVQHEYSPDRILEESLAFLKAHRDERFFLYLPWTLPHANNEAKQAGMEIPSLGAYEDRDWPAPEKGAAAMITRLDRDVGRVLDTLRTLGLDERTIVFFTSDNGPHSEGGHRSSFFDSNGPLRGQKRDLTEGGIRVPLLVRWPKHIAPGSVSLHVAAFWDLMPTVAELANASEHVPASVQGLSFVSTLRGQTDHQQRHEAMYWAFYEGGGGRALRAGDWKLIEQPIGSSARLYDLAEDVGEDHDVATDHPDVVTRMQERMNVEHEPSSRWRWKGTKR